VKVRPVCEKIIELTQGYNNYNFFKGYAYYKLSNYQKALDFFNKSTEKSPDDVLSHIWLARVYWRLGEYEKALNQLATAEKINKSKKNQILIWETYGNVIISNK
jgi:tetratricopeptide (TPR) repeat protein